jgi:hypothetical protein
MADIERHFSKVHGIVEQVGLISEEHIYTVPVYKFIYILYINICNIYIIIYIYCMVVVVVMVVFTATETTVLSYIALVQSPEKKKYMLVS